MSRRLVSQLAAGVVTGVLATGTLVAGGTVAPSWLRLYAVSVFVLVLLWTLWDRLIWRLALVQRLNISPCDIRGTWAGELTSDWRDPATQNPRLPKRVYLVIHQSASRVRVSLVTNEARSESTSASLEEGESGSLLCYTYVDRPRRTSREIGSHSHNGAGVLRVIAKPAVRLEGEYWTDRRTSGDLRLDDRRFKTAADFEQASEWFRSGE